MACCGSVDGVRVAAQLNADGKAGEHAACEQKLRVQICVKLAAYGRLAALVVRGREYGAADLAAGDETEKLTVGDDSGAAVQSAASRRVGKADDRQHIHFGGGLDDPAKGSFRTAEDNAVTDQVVAGGAGQGQLGENNELNAPGVSVFDAFDNFVCVVIGIGDFDHWRSSRDFNKSVFHYFSLISQIFVCQIVLCRNSG